MGIREISKYFDRAISASKSFVDLIIETGILLNENDASRVWADKF